MSEVALPDDFADFDNRVEFAGLYLGETPADMIFSAWLSASDFTSIDADVEPLKSGEFLAGFVSFNDIFLENDFVTFGVYMADDSDTYIGYFEY